MIATFNTTEHHLVNLIIHDETRSGCRIEVITARTLIGEQNGNPETSVTGTRHNIMRLIGLLADHGEDCLLGVTRV